MFSLPLLKSVQIKNSVYKFSLTSLVKFMFLAIVGELVGGNILMLLYKLTVFPGGQFGKNPH